MNQSKSAQFTESAEEHKCKQSHENPIVNVTLPLCSNYAALMFDDIGPLTPSQLGPVGHEKKVRLKASRCS